MRKKTIAFFHPDLGIGGAERLIIDAAVALQERGHKVVIFTSHCDPTHCFDEARDGTLDVRVRGNTVVPPSLGGRFSILCAISRQLHLITSICLSGELRSLNPTDLFVDQLSAGMPLLRFLTGNYYYQSKATTPTPPARPTLFFYCHFPDLLLVQNRASSPLKRLYRIPFDLLEEWSMCSADATAVNSAFTKSIVQQTFPTLASRQTLTVVYPCVDISEPNPEGEEEEKQATSILSPWLSTPTRDDEGKTKTNPTIFLSINRFEKKKDIDLAIKAYSSFLTSSPPPSKSLLLIAGGYDSRVQENVQYHTHLQRLCDTLSLPHTTIFTSSPEEQPQTISSSGKQVLFLPSIPSSLKSHLLQSSTLLLYTPQNEHFGIVPLEAMLSRLPVLAADSGGPKETVVEGVTGWRRDPLDVGAWAEVMKQVSEMREMEKGNGDLRAMGERGRGRVRANFGRGMMAESIDDVFEAMGKTVRRGKGVDPLYWGMFWGVVVLVVGALLAVVLGGGGMGVKECGTAFGGMRGGDMGMGIGMGMGDEKCDV